MTQSGHAISRASMVIAAVSTVVEWYDFTLYLYLATVLSRVFFGGAQGSLVITLAGFALAYLLRPLGAITFGRIGDTQRQADDEAAVERAASAQPPALRSRRGFPWQMHRSSLRSITGVAPRSRRRS